LNSKYLLSRTKITTWGSNSAGYTTFKKVEVGNVTENYKHSTTKNVLQPIGVFINFD
jgi:hypothetical protein